MAISPQQFFGGNIPTERVQVIGNETQIKQDESKSGPTFFGKLTREVAKIPLRVATSAINLGQDILNKPETQPLSNSYTGEITKIGKGFDVTKGTTPENINAIGDATQIGVDIGTLLPAEGLATAGVKKVIGSVENLSKEVIDNASKYPKKLVNNITDKITTLDPQINNVLQTTSIEKFNNYVKAGEEALSNPRVLTPLERAGEKVYNQVLPNMKQDLSNIGSQKAKSLSSVKNVQVPNATNDSISFLKESIKTSRLTKEETKLINEAISVMEVGSSPTLGTLDKTVDLLQSTLYEKAKGLAIPVTSRVEGIVNQTIGKLNSIVKSAAEKALGSKEYTVLNDAYATKIDLFNKLNKAIGEDANRGGSLFKRFFSPQDSGTKNLFAEIKDIYGVDLAEDATLAKFVMDSLGDIRAKSLLEQIPTSKGGLITKTLKKVEEKFTNPIGKAKRIIESKPQ